MIFVFATLSDSNKAFWGAIIGGFLGTVGAFSAALITIFADRRKQKHKKQKDALRQYNQQLISCEVSLNEYLTVMLKNIRLLENCSKASTPGNYYVTLPRVLELKNTHTENLINPELVNNWLTLYLRAKIINQLVEDFTDYYKQVRDTVVDTEIRNQKLNPKIVTQEHQTLLSFAKDVGKAVQKSVDDAVYSLALFQIHGEIGKSPKKKFKNIKQLDKFKLNKRSVNARVKKLSKEFTVRNAFSDV